MADRAAISPVLIRELRDTDSIDELTALLHRAYKRLLDIGLRYSATTQPAEKTRKRIAGGSCLVAEIDGAIVGTATYHRHATWVGVPWVERPDVAVITQLAVEPPRQRQGIGGLLMARVEEMAVDDGAAELALSAEPATHLIDYYAKRGYRLVEHTDATLSSNGYRSVILSKRLTSR